MLRSLIIFCMAFAFIISSTFAVASPSVNDIYADDDGEMYMANEDMYYHEAQENSKIVTEYLLSLKAKFINHLKTTDDGRKILNMWDTFADHWLEFKTDPRGFLISLGIDDEGVLSAADNYIAINENRLKWYEKKGISLRILSCMAKRGDGQVISGLEVNVPDKYYIKKVYDLSPKLDLTGSKNISDVAFRDLFPKRFMSDDLGYNRHFIFPFSVKPLDLKRPINLQLNFSGELCEIATGNCQPFDINLSREFSANSRISSPECGVIWDSFRRQRNTDDIFITSAVWHKDILRIEAALKEHFSKPDVFIETSENIKTEKPNIMYDDGVLTATIKVINAKNLYEKPIHIIFGYPYYFLTTTLHPTVNNSVLHAKSVSLTESCIDGFLLVFFSPILALMIALLVRRNKEKLLHHAVLLSGSILLIYPGFHLIIGDWGQQFLSPGFTFIYSLIMIIGGFYLIYARNLWWAGLAFALLCLISPVHFIENTINNGKISNFLCMSASIFIAVMILFALKTVILKLKPQLLKLFTKVFINTDLSKKIILAVMLFWAIWLAIVSFIEIDSWLEIVIVAFVWLCVFVALQTKKYPALAVFFVIILVILPFTKVNQKDLLTNDSLEEAINDDKIVYAVVDTPWCLSCQIGKASFMASKLVRNMINSDKIVVLKASRTNPIIVDMSEVFNIKKEPLHILYTKQKPDGEILPWFIENYSALKHLRDVGFVGADAPIKIQQK